MTDPTPLPEQLSFHHVGVACRDLDQEAAVLSRLGYCADGPDFTDPIQGVHGRFLIGPGPRLELLAPMGTGGVLEPWLQRGAKLYHLAYSTPTLDDAIAGLQAVRGRLMVGPVPAVAFGGRRIAFLLLPNMLLVELIEAE